MNNFTDLNLDPAVLHAIQDSGYLAPTLIQTRAIPPALEQRDVCGIAQTGTGKTASFIWPLITLLNNGRVRARMPRCLILTPTRELAMQITDCFDTYAKHTALTRALLIGGVSFKDQDAAIERGVSVLIATPGRLLDHTERGKLILNATEIMVVDEADRMLDMGFIPDIERIFELTPFTRQTLLFSATMPPKISAIVDRFLMGCVHIQVTPQSTINTAIEQSVVYVDGAQNNTTQDDTTASTTKSNKRNSQTTRKRATFQHKCTFLQAIIEQIGAECRNAIVFCNRKSDVSALAAFMLKHEFSVAALHGDLEQNQRMQVLGSFRNGEIQFLIASDVAARGLDIPKVSHVFNFDVPLHIEDYVHRIGRTGRAGSTGCAITLATRCDNKTLDKIETLTQCKLAIATMPLVKETTKTIEKEQPKANRQKSTKTKAKTTDQSMQTPINENSNDSIRKQSKNGLAQALKPKNNKATPNASMSLARKKQPNAVLTGFGDHVPAFAVLSTKA